VALGGNAMTGPDGSASPGAQIDAITAAMGPVADLIAAGHEVVLTHGNGPQVGNLLVKNELAAAVVPPVSLDWCGAQTQATIGFTMLNALERSLAAVGASRPVAAIVTRTRVDENDPGFSRPTKPVGRFLPYEQAKPLIEHGQLWENRGEKGWRRMVASPEPVEVLETGTLMTLLDAGYVVVAAGGGGIPVVRRADGSLAGVEAVVDKDLASALLAANLGAEVLLVLTGVEHVAVDFGRPTQRDLHELRAAELAGHAAAGQFAPGSMLPKVQAVLRFLGQGGRRAVITTPELSEKALAGEIGTQVTP